MDLGVEGKVAWVLGASASLRRAMAESLAREGARVAISSRSRDRLEEVAESVRSDRGECRVVPVNVMDPEAIHAGAAEIAADSGASTSWFPTPGRASAEIQAELEARIPVGATATRASSGDTVAFLASERASYINGVSVVVDGGALNTIVS